MYFVLRMSSCMFVIYIVPCSSATRYDAGEVLEGDKGLIDSFPYTLSKNSVLAWSRVRYEKVSCLIAHVFRFFTVKLNFLQLVTRDAMRRFMDGCQNI